MEDEELATVAEGAWEGTALSFVLVAILLWMALRSFRLIWPLLVLIVAGLAWTAAIRAVHRHRRGFRHPALGAIPR